MPNLYGFRWLAVQLILAGVAALMSSGPAVAQATRPAELPISGAPIPMRVLVQSPAATDSDLQVICLFRSEPTNTLHGSLAEINEKLKGLLDRIRQPSSFRGELGETLLLIPPAGSLRAKRVLIIGLGDSQSFEPERMELVGVIAYREAARLGVAHPFFAPTVLDGGVSQFGTGQVSQHVIRGFLRAAATEKIVSDAGASSGTAIQEITFLAGAQHAAETQSAIEKVIASEKGR